MNEILFEAVFDAMPEAVFIVGSDLRLLRANSKAHSIFGIPENAQSLLEATFSTDLEEAAKKASLNNEPTESEITIYKGGKQHFFLVYISSIKDSSIILFLSDITHLRRLENVRKDFAANVSHELRTPIQLIKGYSETMLEQRPDYDELISGMEIILKNAVTMENLTNDLLTLVSLEDKESPRLEMTETNVLELLEEAVNSVEPQRKAKNIEIKVSCAEHSAVLYGPFIIQALINLLDNAIKYSSTASKVELEAEIAKNSEGKELVIKVKDKGIGIPREYQERIFERFFRVDKARSREAGGTGLGLAIVRHISLLHHGRVEVESHAREGSCFTLRIPINADGVGD
jgi:two-component system phosphate regulon sensor histidine kinase PhoR